LRHEFQGDVLLIVALTQPHSAPLLAHLGGMYPRPLLDFAAATVVNVRFLGHFRRCRSRLKIRACRLRPESRQKIKESPSVAMDHDRTIITAQFCDSTTAKTDDRRRRLN
jgi:hypothetical protein